VKSARRRARTRGPAEIGLLGVPRSGTNYVRAVLELNYRCRIAQNLYGWKHGFLPIGLNNTRIGTYVRRHSTFVWVTKHPLDSIHSLYRYHLDVNRNIRAPKDWSNFLRSPIFLLDSGSPVSPEYRFANPVDLWNSLNWNYLSGEKLCHAFHLKYEDAYLSPQTAFDRAAQFLDIERRSEGPLTIPSERMRRLGQRSLGSYEQYVTSRDFDKRDYYLTKEYLSKYSSEDLQFVQLPLDRELAETLGYQP